MKYKLNKEQLIAAVKLPTALELSTAVRATNRGAFAIVHWSGEVTAECANKPQDLPLYGLRWEETT